MIIFIMLFKSSNENKLQPITPTQFDFFNRAIVV